MTDARKIDHGGPAFPILSPVDETGRTAAGYPFPEEGMSLRQYYATHCPISMSEAYEIWSGNRESSDSNNPKFRDSMMSIGLRRGTERLGFFEWWALMRYEYADAMVAAGNGGA